MKEVVPISLLQSKVGMSATESVRRKPGYCRPFPLKRTMGGAESAFSKSVGRRGKVSKYNQGVAKNSSTLEALIVHNFDYCPTERWQLSSWPPKKFIEQRAW